MTPVKEGSDREPRQGGTPPMVGDHALLRRIGEGAYGEVWLARAVTGSLRAVKVIQRETFRDADQYEREFAGICRFEPLSRNHPHQVHVLHVGRSEPGHHYYYVMELADDARGGEGAPERLAESATAAELAGYRPRTLQSDLARAGHLPVPEVLRIGIALASALEHLHGAGLVHRDVKPANVIFVHNIPKLADIGLVTDGPDSGWALGTPGYVPIEGATGTGGDLYALGKVLYELATGLDRHRFPESPPDLPQRADRAWLLRLDAIVHRACDPVPRCRYPTATAFKKDLESLARKTREAAPVGERGTRRAPKWMLPVLGLVLAVSAAWLLDRRPVPVAVPAATAPEGDTGASGGDGFQPLLGGTGLEGWTSRKGNWEVRDGVVSRERGGGHLHRVQFLPAHFELRFDWRIGTNADSGIRYADGHAEYQCVDDARHPYGQDPHRRSGSLYGQAGPERSMARPAGEWNEGRIVKRGSRVEHWLNGQCVARADLADPAVADRIRNATTFRPAGQVGVDFAQRRPDQSILALVENHGAISFRRLRFRELPEAAGR